MTTFATRWFRSRCCVELAGTTIVRPFERGLGSAGDTFADLVWAARSRDGGCCWPEGANPGKHLGGNRSAGKAFADHAIVVGVELVDIGRVVGVMEPLRP